MSEQFEPELGQALFGQSGQPLSADIAVECVMDSLSAAFDVLHPDEGNPFSNSGARWKWSCFEVHAYSWSGDEQEFNFKWGDFIVCWYKYSGRGVSQSREISAADLATMFRECMGAMLNETPVDADA